MIIKFFGRQIYIRKDVACACISVFVIALGLAGFIISSDKDVFIIETLAEEQPVKESDKSGDITSTPKPALLEQPNDEIKIYVIGCVNNPGIVTLKKGQIIDEAIKLAGGATEEADLKSINLVYKLKDNAVIYIKSYEETKNTANAKVDQKWASSGEAGPGIDIKNDSAGAILNAAQTGSMPKVININTVSQSELETLPGIGKETANDIISYRDKNGGFKTINDIMKVSGIKESRFSKIKDLITVE